jgi:hypothetical protein
VIGVLIFAGPVLMRSPALRRNRYVRLIELAGGTALLIKAAEAIRNYEPPPKPTELALPLGVTRQARLLENHPALGASIRLRLPYIDPLNLLQVELLKRHRAGEHDPRVREGIQLSINAVATALRNSG